MTNARAYLIDTLRHVIDGGDVTHDMLDAAIPDPARLRGAERKAWYGLSYWADDDDIRVKDPAYASMRRLQLCDLLADLEGRSASVSRSEKLWVCYWGIRDSHQSGLRMPILRHLAFTGDTDAMIELSSELPEVGRISDRYSQQGLAYAAYRRGNPLGPQHLAMIAFNRNDLRGYRYWLNKATRMGDIDAGHELRRFETRLPHSCAAAIRRTRSYRRSDRV